MPLTFQLWRPSQLDRSNLGTAGRNMPITTACIDVCSTATDRRMPVHANANRLADHHRSRRLTISGCMTRQSRRLHLRSPARLASFLGTSSSSSSSSPSAALKASSAPLREHRWRFSWFLLQPEPAESEGHSVKTIRVTFRIPLPRRTISKVSIFCYPIQLRRQEHLHNCPRSSAQCPIDC